MHASLHTSKDTSLALVSFNGDAPNRGTPAIQKLALEIGYNAVDLFDARKKHLPNITHYNVFVCTGGPGDPEDWGQNTGNPDDNWGKGVFDFYNQIEKHNQNNPDNPKYLFLICHSFQLGCKNWNLGTLYKRDQTLLGVHEQVILEYAKSAPYDYFRELKKPFYTFESRDYAVKPKYRSDGNGDFIPMTLDANGALTSVCSKDGFIIGMQFHPEATVEETKLILNDVTLEKNKKAQEAILHLHGQEELDRMRRHVTYLDTSNDILRTFLLQAKEGRALQLTA